MSSSPPSTTEREAPAAAARPAFDWIEVCAIPISVNIMETQPIVMFLLFIAVFVAGPGTPLPLGEVGITLLLLGLQEWAMFINYRLRHGMHQETANLLHVLGVVVAFGLALLTNLTIFGLPTIVVIAGLVIFCWKRGIDKAKTGLNDEQLMFVFKLGLGILLVVLGMDVLFQSVQMTDAFAALTYALPLFFLSGLIGLSFTRVSMIRREHARQGMPQADPTRGWLVALTFLWGVMVAGALALETFSFRTLQALLLPLWNILAIIVAAILFVIVWVIAAIYQLSAWLFHLKFVSPNTSQTSPKPTIRGSHTPSIADQFPWWLILLGRLVLIALLLLLLFIIFRAILRHARPLLKEDSEEEIREALSVRTILRERREERKQQIEQAAGPMLEALDPDSIRARYRELLQQMAQRGERLSRRPEETPTEYQKRLTTLLEKSPTDDVQADMATDREALADLTRGYITERYGERHVELHPHSDSSTWISRLAERLGRRGA